MSDRISRRKFLGNSAAVTAGLWLGGGRVFGKGKSPNEKLNIGIIGVGNRAGSNIKGVQSENIVAICDVDEKYLSAAARNFPDAKQYADFRKLLEQKNIDAVVISTPDHTHAPATVIALKTGRHVYCEKPLTHTVHEARAVAKAAAKNKKLATQMGTQIHAGENYRRCVELIQSGAIGEVKECHVWCERTRFGGNPAPVSPVPSNVNWDLWIGPAPERPYHADYHPRNWRGYWNFGGGTLGDMGCHFIDLAFWALDLKFPQTIEAEGPPIDSEITPTSMIARYEFALKNRTLPLTWYDGGKKPALILEGAAPDWRNGVLFVGDKGMLIADYFNRKLLPEDQFNGFPAPDPFIANSIGHYNEWLQACKTGSPTTCNFAYGAMLTEAVLLGNVAYRTGKKSNGTLQG